MGEAASGEEALAVVLRERPDVVIADLMMPRLNGLELTRRIKQDRPQTKILLMSAYTEDTYRRIASVSGADGFVNKHLIHTGLLPAIREASPAPSRAGARAAPRSAASATEPLLNLSHPLLYPLNLPR